MQLTVAQSLNTVGSDLFTFGLLTKAGAFIEGGEPQVWFARGQETSVVGPFTATWNVLGRAYTASGDRSPNTTLPGYYAANIRLPDAGTWFAAAVAASARASAAGVTTTTVVARAPASVGSQALKTPTPVASTPSALAAICTREPPDVMHYISLDVALTSGKPVVACFATPLLCESRMCAPVLDEVLAIYQQVGRERAAFIHIEEYPGGDSTKPAPAFTAWSFTTEPWTLVIDRDGVIRTHFEGPVNAAQISAALTPLL